MMIRIPEYVNQVLAVLESAGWEAYVVGGCVRDALLAREPEDWDVCTCAKPSSIKSAFSDWRTIDTGLKHGTVTVLSEGHPVEITTYRIDGNYSDGRHPDSVSFTDDLTADLSRRDFTMNAIAYREERGLVDPFGGAADIAAGVIRCVGDPAQRFSEDALRIMRALRFASVLGFAIEPATLAAVRAMAGSVRRVAVERINVEFSKLILGAGADRILTEERSALEEALGTALPAVAAGGSPAEEASGGLLAEKAAGGSPAEKAAGTTLRPRVPLAELPAELPIRLAALRPLPLKALKYDNRTIRLAKRMGACADRIAAQGQQTGADPEKQGDAVPKMQVIDHARRADTVPDEDGTDRVLLLQLMRDYGPEAAAGGLLLCGLSDEPVRKLVEEGAVYSIAQLAVGGNDLTTLTGKEIGNTLRLLLDAVIEGRVPNDRGALLEFVNERSNLRRKKSTS